MGARRFYWTLAILLAAPTPAFGCTTLLVGKSATVDGSVMATHSNDGGGTTDPRLVRIPARDWPAGSTRPIWPNPESYPRFVGGGSAAALAPKNEGVGMVPSTFNLMKNILGAGVLSLPAGVAAFSDSKTALLPALALTATLGLTSGYCFAMIGRLCESA